MKDDPEYYYREVKMRKLIRIDRETGEREEVTVTNRNNLPDNEHLRLLNLNDVKYLYEETD